MGYEVQRVSERLSEGLSRATTYTWVIHTVPGSTGRPHIAVVVAWIAAIARVYENGVERIDGSSWFTGGSTCSSSWGHAVEAGGGGHVWTEVEWLREVHVFGHFTADQLAHVEALEMECEYVRCLVYGEALLRCHFNLTSETRGRQLINRRSYSGCNAK